MDWEHQDFASVEEAAEHFRKIIAQNAGLLAKYSVTGTQEVDFKLAQARMALALGLNWLALVGTCIALEEGLKTLIKMKLRDFGSVKDIGAIDQIALEVERKVGSLDLHQAIEKARKENLITETEEERLFEIKDSFRKVFIHSDKTKFLSKEPDLPVEEVKIEHDQVVKSAEAQFSGLGFFFGHAILELNFCDQHARPLFDEVNALVVRLHNRYFSSKEQS